MGNDKTAKILKNNFESMYNVEKVHNNDEYVEQFIDELEEIIEEKTNKLINALQKETT